MANLTIHNVSSEIHNALKSRAKKSGRSTEGEIRFILEQTLMPQQRPNLDDVFEQFRQRTGGVELENLRDKDIVDALDLTI